MQKHRLQYSENQSTKHNDGNLRLEQCKTGTGTLLLYSKSLNSFSQSLYYENPKGYPHYPFDVGSYLSSHCHHTDRKGN